MNQFIQNFGDVNVLTLPMFFYDYNSARRFFKKRGIDSDALFRMVAVGAVQLSTTAVIDGEIVTVGQGVGHA